jgi:hypothetical protein
VLVFNGGAVAGEREKSVRMPQDVSAKAWPMSSIPPEQIAPKRWAGSFSMSETPTRRRAALEASYRLRENIVASRLTGH